MWLPLQLGELINVLMVYNSKKAEHFVGKEVLINKISTKVTFKKWQFSTTPGVLNVLERAPIAITR